MSHAIKKLTVITTRGIMLNGKFGDTGKLTAMMTKKELREHLAKISLKPECQVINYTVFEN